MIITAMVPARMGSTRLKMKNLASLDGKPMVSYVLEAAKKANVFNAIYLNSEHENFSSVANDYGVQFYHRPTDLGGSSTKSDDVVFDFMEKHPSDYVAWVNSTSPLQTAEEIQGAINYMISEKLDTLMTVRDEQVHCVFNDQPVNFSFDGKFSQTQDLIPVRRFVYSIMAWKCSTFIENYKKTKTAFFSGKVGYYNVSKESSIIVKTEEDLRLISGILHSRKENWTLDYTDYTRGLK